MQANSSMPSISLGADFIANPFPMLEMLRNNMPVFRYELPNGKAMWFITRFEDAIRALRDTRLSSNAYHTLGGGQAGRQSALGLERSMVFLDDPDHARLRTLVSKAFTPRFIEELRPRIEEIADALLDKVEPRKGMDLVDDFAFPLPINVISEMLGVPPEDREQIREGSSALSDATSTDPRRWQQISNFAAFVRKLIAQKRSQPADDLISRLVNTNDDDKLTEQELLGMVSLLIFAGHETTSNLIGNGMLALLSQPAQIERLKNDPSLIPGAIEELLRYCGPAVSTGPRFATEDVEIGGQVIKRGDMVNVVIGSGDRDSSQFTDPDELDVARKVERHLAFGHGIHYCLGAPLARLEGQIAFGALITRFPNLQLDCDPNTLTWRGNSVLRGLASLPVKW
ncbi:MAG: cytochrome P450 [Anaerolineae bacterium]|nr:cytochrome P450 [Anaerolineae bacterium]